MKVLHVIQRYWPYVGGSERYMQELSERLVQEGHEVHVYTTDAWDLEYFWDRNKRRIAGQEEVVNGVQVCRFPVLHLPLCSLAYRGTRRFMSLVSKLPFNTRPLLCLLCQTTPLVPGLRQRLQGEGPHDLVHAVNIPFDSLVHYAFCYARRWGIPFLITPFVHLGEPENDIVRQQYTMQHQMEIMRRSDRVITQTTLERDHLVERNVPGEKIAVVGMGVNAQELEGGSGQEFRRRHNINVPIVLHLGTLAYDKGTQHLVEAMQRLWEAGCKAWLVLAGHMTDSFRRHFDSLPAEVRSRCLVLGFLSGQEKKDLLAACDVLVMPSRTDSFGIVYLEAWLYKKPVIGALAGGVPEVISEGQDGYLVRFGDVETLAQRIASLLTRRDMAHRLGEAGYLKATKIHTWERKYALVRKVYEELLELRQGRTIDMEEMRDETE